MPCSCCENGIVEPSPQKSKVNLSQEKPRKATRTMKQRIGTSLATVVTTFITAACFTPRVSMMKMPHVITDTAAANTHRLFSGAK